MRTYGLYLIRAKPELLDCPGVERDFAEMLFAERPLYRKPEGGISPWFAADHETFIKLLFLADQKTEWNQSFFVDAPISVAFFDQWWTIEKCDHIHDTQNVIDNLCPELLDAFIETGIPHVDKYFNASCRHEVRTDFYVDPTKYRIWWNGDVIGWLEDPEWEFPFIRGRWSPTTNPHGRRFRKEHSDAKQYNVVVDGDSYLHGEFVNNDGLVTVKVAFASSDRHDNAQKDA